VTAADVRTALGRYCKASNVISCSLNPIGSLTKARQIVEHAAAGEIQRFVLPNGLRLLVREDPRVPLVSIAATFRAGLLAETPETNGITRLARKRCSRARQRGPQSKSLMNWRASAVESAAKPGIILSALPCG
jgi:zinc protease